jgi:predicted lipoprotein with Yx(FWY)xxD motif
MRRLLVLLAVVVGVAGATGTATANRMVSAPKITVSGSQFGKILFDGRRKALYAFTRDGRGPSRCYGACAAAWPPFLVGRKPSAAPGVRRGLIGTVRRQDGRLQATYRGRPLYYYVGDRSPGQILCQNAPEFGGIWYVVRPTGAPVR